MAVSQECCFGFSPVCYIPSFALSNLLHAYLHKRIASIKGTAFDAPTQVIAKVQRGTFLFLSRLYWEEVRRQWR